MKETPKQIKLADVFFEAANNHLANEGSWDKDRYSCIAIKSAALKLAGEKEQVTDPYQSGSYKPFPSSERWVNCTTSQWSKKAKEQRPVTYAALKFAKEAGCPTGSTSAMSGVKTNTQGVRYQWLMTLAMLAEEENVVVKCKA